MIIIKTFTSTNINCDNLFKLCQMRSIITPIAYTIAVTTPVDLDGKYLG